MLIKNAVVKWASVLAPNTKFEPRWEVCIYPDEAGAEEMEEAGLALKEDKESGELFYRATRVVTAKSGKKMSPPKVVDGLKEPWDENKLIGNGSVCNVIISTKEVENFGKKSTKGYLNKLQVVKWVPYEGGENFDEIGATEVAKESPGENGGGEEDF